MLLAYVILLPDDVHNAMRRAQRAVYQRYPASDMTRLLEPHITIKQPFEADELEPYDAYLDRLAAETAPFEIVMSGWATFPEEGVVFLDVEQDPRLLELQHRVLRELALEPAEYESGEPVPYHFHGTIAQAIAEADLAGAVAGLGEAPEFRFPLERLGLYLETEAGWLLYRRVTIA